MLGWGLEEGCIQRPNDFYPAIHKNSQSVKCKNIRTSETTKNNKTTYSATPTADLNHSQASLSGSFENARRFRPVSPFPRCQCWCNMGSLILPKLPSTDTAAPVQFTLHLTRELCMLEVSMRTFVPLHQGKHQQLQCSNLDWLLLNSWCKSVLPHIGGSGTGREAGYGMCHCPKPVPPRPDLPTHPILHSALAYLRQHALLLADGTGHPTSTSNWCTATVCFLHVGSTCARGASPSGASGGRARPPAACFKSQGCQS